MESESRRKEPERSGGPQAAVRESRGTNNAKQYDNTTTTTTEQEHSHRGGWSTTIEQSFCSMTYQRSIYSHYNQQLRIRPILQSTPSSLRLRRLILTEPQTNTIHTMPLIRRSRISLSLEDMAQMPVTVTANDLNALHPKRAVHIPLHRAGDRVEVRRPAAAGLELVRGLV
jgi:hypothetical protein